MIIPPRVVVLSLSLIALLFLNSSSSTVEAFTTVHCHNNNNIQNRSTLGWTTTATTVTTADHHQCRRCRIRNGTTTNTAAAAAVSSSAAAAALSEETMLTTSLKDLLEGLQTDPNGGMRLLRASSPSWRRAIYQALAVPDNHADETMVANRLTSAMSKSDNQFAILMGKSNSSRSSSSNSSSFVATFPSDPVINDEDGTAWVECRLRQADSTDQLLVTMGISLVRQAEADGQQQDPKWLIAALDWQDFRDEFYPGLSGREWLRAF